MKAMMMLLPMLASCQTPRRVTLPSGSMYSDFGHLGGDTAVVLKPDGTFVAYDKLSQSFQDAAQLIAAVAAAREAAEVGVVVSRNRRITNLGSQRQATAQAALKAEIAKARLAAELEKFRLTRPMVTPVTP